MGGARSSTQRTRGARFSEAQRQEQRSIGQVIDCFSEWSVNRVINDLGEDLYVQIFDDGHTTGLSFTMQLKSTPDITSHALASKPVFSYPFEIKDLEHWEDQSPPVVLVLWDVTNRNSAWIDVPAAIKGLDRRQPGWRNRDTAKVHLPTVNRTDVAGQQALRRRIAHLSIPLIARDKRLVLKPSFLFPKTEEGMLAFNELKRAIDTGEPGTIQGKYITALRASDWWERAYGEEVPDSIAIKSTEVDLSLRMSLLAPGNRRTESLSIELRRSQAGLRQMTFSNAHEHGPAMLKLVIDNYKDTDAGIDGTLGFSFPRPRVAEALALARFLLAFYEAGTGFLCLEDGRPLGEFKVSSFKSLPTEVELVAWEQLLMKLALIQSRLGQYGVFDLSEGISDDEVREIDRLHSMCMTGKWRARSNWTLEMPAPPKSPAGSAGLPDKLVMETDRVDPIVLLGVTIPVGKVRVVPREIEKVVAAMQEAVESKSSRISIPSILVDFELISWGKVSPIQRSSLAPMQKKGRTRKPVRDSKSSRSKGGRS